MLILGLFPSQLGFWLLEQLRGAHSNYLSQITPHRDHRCRQQRGKEERELMALRHFESLGHHTTETIAAAVMLIEVQTRCL